jgi:hypothetical protein
MNSKTFFGSHVAGALCLVALAGCGSGSVGADPCVTSGDCNALALSKPEDKEAPGYPEWKMEAVEVRPTETLSIDWVKRLPGPLDPGLSSRVLQSDATGKLVLFVLNDDKQAFSVARLNDAGDVLEKVSVAAPDGWTVDSATRVGLGGPGAVIPIDGSVGVKASWFTQLADQPTLLQKLIFSPDIKQPPKRWDLANGAIDDVHQDINGDLYVVQSDPDNHVTKLDAETGAELWTQTDFPQARPSSTPPRLELAGVPLDDGRVVALSEPVESATENAVSFLDATGKRTKTQTTVPTGGFLLNAGDHATFVTGDVGDVMVIKLVDPSHNESVQFLRNDYALLWPEASAIDPAGNVYFGTHNGSRLDPKPTLCRAHASGGGNCYTLPATDAAFTFNEIIARDNGELFIHSDSDLIHVTYPQ